MKPDSANALPSRPSPGAAGQRLASLYEEHARMVYGVCRLLLRDADEAEDAAQQVFLSAYRSLLSGTEPRTPGAWLGTIARNEARARLASRRAYPVALDGDRVPASATLEEQAGTRADFADLRDELSALPEKQREAVVLRDLFGLRYDEVARALDLSRPAVEALLFRGRRRLQRRLRPELAAGILVVPLALRESIAYAVPGFAAGGASTAGVLTKLAAVPIAAKLAAAGATVGVVGSAGVIAERELHDPPARPAAALVERLVRQPPAIVLQPVAVTRDAGGEDVDDVRPAGTRQDEDAGDDDAAEPDEDGDRGRRLTAAAREDEPRHEEADPEPEEAEEPEEGEEPDEPEHAEEPDEPDEPEALEEHDEPGEADELEVDEPESSGEDR